MSSTALLPASEFLIGVDSAREDDKTFAYQDGRWFIIGGRQMGKREIKDLIWRYHLDGRSKTRQ